MKYVKPGMIVTTGSKSADLDNSTGIVTDSVSTLLLSRPMKILKYRFDAEVSRDDLRKIVQSLSSELKLSALGLSLTQHLSERLNVSFNYEPVVPSGPIWNSYVKASDAAEILCDNNSILVLQNETRSSAPRGLLALGREEKSCLSVTAISQTLEECDRLLSSVHVAIRKQIIQPRSRIKISEGYFIHENCNVNVAYLQQLRDSGTYAQPAYEKIDFELSKRLRTKEIREFILRLLQSRVLTDTNFSQEISQLGADENLAELLIDNGFVFKETFIECRQNSQRIARFQSDELSLESLNIKCATCNRFYREERLYSAYVASEKLKLLLSSSRWMNVLVTEILIECGVPKEFIYWNVNFGADEIDIIAFVGGLPWAFELKDREFSVTDAHHFNYRRSVVQPSEAIVITSAFVSPDAKKIFKDTSGVATTILGSNPTLPEPELIEGLNGIQATLQELLKRHSEIFIGMAIKRALGGIENRISEIVLRSLKPPKNAE